MPNKKTTPVNPKVHEQLKGFKMEINSFGEITSSFNVDRLNDFLNDKVDDKKLRDRDDLDFIREKKENAD